MECDLLQNVDLDEIRFRAIELTIQGLSDTQIAERLMINRRTLWRWKTHDEDYRWALAEARTQAYSTVADCSGTNQKPETRMKNQARNPKPESCPFRHSGFGFDSSFGFRVSGLS